MTNGRSTDQKRLFTLTWLPWLLGALVLVLPLPRQIAPCLLWLIGPAYYNSPHRDPLCRLHACPGISAPVYYIVTYPLRWLPVQHIPLALNFFSVLCGCWPSPTGCSVALLPHDRTRDQRERETTRHSYLTIPLAWLPPVFATVVCALSLSVWGARTNAPREMFDLLLFAYVVRSLLEYRVDQKESRLYRTAFVLGAAITNNLAMIAFFPLFVVALVWDPQAGVLQFEIPRPHGRLRTGRAVVLSGLTDHRQLSDHPP